MSSPTIKVGDTVDGPRVRLLEAGGNPADLTGATVVMNANGVQLPCTVDDPAGGTVHVPRGALAPDTGSSVKSFPVEFQVTYADATIQTFPTDGYARLVVWDDLD